MPEINKSGQSIKVMHQTFNLGNTDRYRVAGHHIAHNKDYEAEGMIMKSPVGLFNRQGQRIIAKIKFRDFIR